VRATIYCAASPAYNSLMLSFKKQTRAKLRPGELCEAPARKKLVSDSMSLNWLR